ncbi:BTAD domain-containing putative transcriptional regulator [Streptomyces sp. ISL-111]|uniref:AfsR/SARP family transcriptional regulator n=1 Tax=unclassified Streptomyces TaxID=2593676 RepID=UPI0035ABFCCD
MEAAWASARAEPPRESAHRAVMSAPLAEGNVAEAVRHYAAFCRLLDEELGVEPSPRFARMLPGRPRDRGRRAAPCTRAFATTGSPSTTRSKGASASCTWTSRGM